MSHLCFSKKYFVKSVYTANHFPFIYYQKIFCQVSVHCKQFPIYVFPTNILPSQCTLQTVSHLYFPKNEFSQVSLLISTIYFLKQNYIVLSGIMIFWREVHRTICRAIQLASIGDNIFPNGNHEISVVQDILISRLEPQRLE
jgi:hypothetical protein